MNSATNLKEIVMDGSVFNCILDEAKMSDLTDHSGTFLFHTCCDESRFETQILFERLIDSAERIGQICPERSFDLAMVPKRSVPSKHANVAIGTTGNSIIKLVFICIH